MGVPAAFLQTTFPIILQPELEVASTAQRAAFAPTAVTMRFPLSVAAVLPCP